MFPKTTLGTEQIGFDLLSTNTIGPSTKYAFIDSTFWQEFETNKACILVDDAGQTYATGSKMFTNQMKRFIVMYGVETIKNGLEIKIVKKKMKDSGNKALAFELI